MHETKNLYGFSLKVFSNKSNISLYKPGSWNKNGTHVHTYRKYLHEDKCHRSTRALREAGVMYVIHHDFKHRILDTFETTFSARPYKSLSSRTK